jgi:hypothetical protein
MTDFPPPPPLGGNHRKPWIWVAGGIVIAVIAVAVVAQSGDETTQAQAETESPMGDPTPSPTPSPSPSPTPAEIIYPEMFDWTVPDVIGMTKNEARAVIQDSVASATPLGTT